MAENGCRVFVSETDITGAKIERQRPLLLYALLEFRD
jgi:hypothetical protein